MKTKAEGNKRKGFLSREEQKVLKLNFKE